MTGARVAGSGLASAVVLSLWLGAAIVVTTVVAPAAFAVLPTRALAGALVGRVLPVLFWSGAVVGVIVAVLARGQGTTRAALLASLAVTIACLAAQLVVAPRIARLRVDAGVPIDRLAREDPRRIGFGRLHAASVALLGVAALAGSAALFFTVRTLGTNSVRHGTSNPLHEP
jgi:hypothetical protein